MAQGAIAHLRTGGEFAVLARVRFDDQTGPTPLLKI
jgi:hypothetical protein